MKKVFLAVLMLVMGIAFLLPPMNHANAQTNGEITWGKVMTGVYNDLHPYTLNWSGNVLDKGGLNLASMKVTGSHEADLVI
ncbi:hypothetical protein MOQ26_23705, partial [Stenotrophomonas maltophilia]|nr:hypothetical protein [Stenotrophomonas maltophilia]